VENHECLRLRVHILLDGWGTKAWKKTTEVMTPYGFKFRSGFHPAYKAMRNGQFEIEETALISSLLDKVKYLSISVPIWVVLRLLHVKRIRK
jgi:hypothetical protein